MFLLSLVIWQINADRGRLHVQAVNAICFYQGTPASDQKEPVIFAARACCDERETVLLKMPDGI